MSQFKLFLKLAFLPAHVKNAIPVTIVVGTLLNLINQGDGMMDEKASIDFPKVLLTFCVPFLVSVYSAAKAKMVVIPGQPAMMDATVRCSNCQEVMDLKMGEVIPACTRCDKTKWKLISL